MRAVLVIDGAAQLGLARIELLAPSRRRGVEDRRCVFCAIQNQSAQAFARSGEPILEDLTAHDNDVLQAVGSVVEAHDEIVAVDDDGVGKPRAASREPLDQRIRPDAEIAGHRVARLAQSVGDGVALSPDRLDGPRAACIDTADDVVGIGLDGAAHRMRGVGKLVGDRVPVSADRLDGLEPLALTRLTTSSA